jgi:hypothetical protein
MDGGEERPDLRRTSVLLIVLAAEVAAVLVWCIR